MLYLLISLFVICLVALRDKDIRRDSFSTYFIGIIAMGDAIVMIYYIIKIMEV